VKIFQPVPMSGANCHFSKLNFSNPLKKSPDRVICLECLCGQWALLRAAENQYKTILSLTRGVDKTVCQEKASSLHPGAGGCFLPGRDKRIKEE